MQAVEWSGPALRDLRAINAWLEREATPDLAFLTLKAVRARGDFLERHPHGGRPYKDGMRVLVVFGTPYLIVYRLIAERAEVLRVHHERENWHVTP